MDKKLYKREADKMVCGVCGGLADFFGIDVTIIRIVWAAFVCLGGTGLALYIIMALILDDEPSDFNYTEY